MVKSVLLAVFGLCLSLDVSSAKDDACQKSLLTKPNSAPGLDFAHLDVPSSKWTTPKKLPDLASARERFRAQSYWYETLEDWQLENYFVLWNTLVDAVQQAKFSPPSNRRIRILNLACGKGDESYLLSSFFGAGDFLAPSLGGEVVGLDQDPDLILRAQAKQRHARRQSGKSEVAPVTFVKGDATDMETVSTLGLFDVVILRHPHVFWDLIWGKSNRLEIDQGRRLTNQYQDIVWGTSNDWFSIIKNGINALAPNAILISTFYDVNERSLASTMFSTHAIEQVWGTDQNSNFPPERQIKNDTAVSVFRRR